MHLQMPHEYPTCQNHIVNKACVSTVSLRQELPQRYCNNSIDWTKNLRAFRVWVS